MTTSCICKTRHFRNAVILVFASMQVLSAQSLKRQTIASSTGSKSSEGVIVNQTIGQPYHTKTTQSGNVSYRPGFQQPVFSTELIKTSVNVTLLPNPALYSFFIECSDTLYDATLSTYDEAGRIIFSEKIATLVRHEVQCANWANGVYLISVTDRKNNLISAKLIKTQ